MGSPVQGGIGPNGRRGLSIGEAAAVDLLGIIHLDMVGDQPFYFTKTLTHERVRLLAGEYEAISNGEKHSLVIVHLAAWEHTETAEIFVMYDRLGKDSMRSWWEVVTRYRSASVNCSLGSQAAFAVPPHVRLPQGEARSPAHLLVVLRGVQIVVRLCSEVDAFVA